MPLHLKLLVAGASVALAFAVFTLGLRWRRRIRAAQETLKPSVRFDLFTTYTDIVPTAGAGGAGSVTEVVEFDEHATAEQRETIRQWRGLESDEFLSYFVSYILPLTVLVIGGAIVWRG